MSLSPLLPVDPVTVGGFRLSARLGAGGMGVVYLGADRAGRPAAVKVIRGEYAADAEFRSRFKREVRAATAVAGAATARLLDADPDTDPPWLATEYVAGPSLAEVVTADGPLDPTLLRALAVGLAQALVAIHGAAVVHRDLKPSNVLLADTGPKVIDFGIAAAADTTVATRTGVGLGSPGYMAPEQITGDNRVGPPADVFAWALTVLYAATGRPPFGTGRSDAVLYRAVHGEADTSGVPPGLLPAVTAALERDPARRPNATELLGLLPPPGHDPEAALTGQDWHALTAWLPRPVPTTPRAAGRRRLRRLVVLAVSSVLLLGTTAIGVRVAFAGNDTDRGSAPAGTAAASATAAAPPAETANTEPTPTLAAASVAVAQFQGKVGHFGAATSFTDFILTHDAQVVLLDLSATADGNEETFKPGPDYGGDDRPNFTLFSECAWLPPGGTPGFDPDLRCAGTVYRLAIGAESDAYFAYVQGAFYVKGYFSVSLVPGVHQGLTAVNIRAVNVEDLPG